MSISQMKREALSKLKGNWVQAIIVMIIYSILTYNLGSDNYLAQKVYGDIGILSSIDPYVSNDNVNMLFKIILGGPLELGICIYFLNILRDKDIMLNDMFKGFKYFWNTFLLQLLITIRIILWSLLLIIPGIIAALKYAMAFYIMSDNLEIGVDEAIEQSKVMMEGHKWDLVLVELSFIGWYILEVLTFGIAAIWVRPYHEMTIANFYEKLRLDNDIKIEME